MENFRIIHEFYAISDEGTFKSLERDVESGNQYGRFIKHLEEQVIEPQEYGKGHLHVQVCINGKRKWYAIHQLVAEAFLENPNGYTVVHHKDLNPQNNKVENLCWMDRSEHQALHNKLRKKETN